MKDNRTLQYTNHMKSDTEITTKSEETAELANIEKKTHVYPRPNQTTNKKKNLARVQIGQDHLSFWHRGISFLPAFITDEYMWIDKLKKEKHDENPWHKSATRTFYYEIGDEMKTNKKKCLPTKCVSATFAIILDLTFFFCCPPFRRSHSFNYYEREKKWICGPHFNNGLGFFFFISLDSATALSENILHCIRFIRSFRFFFLHRILFCCLCNAGREDAEEM